MGVRLCRCVRSLIVIGVCLLALPAARAGAAAGDVTLMPSEMERTGRLYGAPAPLPYDPAAWEISPHVPRGLRPWTAADVRTELRARVVREKARREMLVYYYRIGHTMAFPLPVSARPTLAGMPPGLPSRNYPWVIWLSWGLEERWRVLLAAWRQLGDVDAGALLQRDLAALATWENFKELNASVGLPTGHIAGCLARALADPSGWDPLLRRQALTAAEALLERDVWPWFDRQWPDGQAITAARLQNIPCIALVRAAQLARVVGSPRVEALDGRAREVLEGWCRLRVGPERHTEGTAYDGYLMDSLTEWLAGLPGRDQVLPACREAFASQSAHWIHLTLPGRPDLHAPLSDVEPEMPFWANALGRLSRWYAFEDAAWLLRRFPLVRLPAASLERALDDRSLPAGAVPPAPAPREHPNALSLRTGWDSADVLAAVGLSRGGMGHLHADAGHVLLGWQNRFWITDPGYQQYRPGEERDFTLGVQAHNAPVIAGAAQASRAGALLALDGRAGERQHALVDLTPGYRGLPEGASVRRDVWLIPGQAPAVVVRDTLAGLGKDVEIRTHWQGGTHLAWAFREGWARLSDGERAVWIGTVPGAVEAAKLTRHPGSRGPLTLEHVETLPDGSGTRWWVLACDPSGGWAPPRFEAGGDAPEVRW